MRRAGDMVKEALRANGMTQIELAEKIGKDQTLISRFISGQPVSDTTARSIAEVLNIDLDEFVRQLQVDRLERKKKSLRTQFKGVIEGGEVLSNEEESLIGHVGIEDVSNYIAIPLIDYVPLDSEKRWADNIKTYVVQGVNIDKDKAFAMKVGAEDMIDDKVEKGDIIVIDPTAEVLDDDRVLVVVGNRPKLKKIYRSGESIVFQSSGNSKEPVIVLSQKDDFKIIGKLMLCIKHFVD